MIEYMRDDQFIDENFFSEDEAEEEEDQLQKTDEGSRLANITPMDLDGLGTETKALLNLQTVQLFNDSAVGLTTTAKQAQANAGQDAEVTDFARIVNDEPEVTDFARLTSADAKVVADFVEAE